MFLFRKAKSAFTKWVNGRKVIRTNISFTERLRLADSIKHKTNAVTRKRAA
jgi:hypothetical protein